MTHSFTIKTLFKECEDVITVKDHDDKELITVNLRLINSSVTKTLKKKT